MGLFEKKESDSNYSNLRDVTVKEYKALIVKNPFAPADVLNRQWDEMYQRIKQLQKQSKKYSDTVDDVSILKIYMDDAKARRDDYAHEIEYLKYLDRFNSICKEYEQLKEDDYGDDYLSNLNLTEKMYDRLCDLKSEYYLFAKDNIDEDKLNEMHGNMAYYYCVWLQQMNHYDSDDGQGITYREAEQYLEKCIRVSKKYKGDRFRVIEGVANYELCLIWEYYEENTSSESDYKRCYDKKIAYSNTALKLLNVLKGTDYKAYPFHVRLYFSFFDNIEWLIMRIGFRDLFSLCIFHKRYDEAHYVAESVISTQSLTMRLDERYQELVEEFKEKLTHFRETRNGGWNYVE